MKKWLMPLAVISSMLLVLWVLLIRSSNIFAEGQATYVGVDKCKECHPNEFKQFDDNFAYTKTWKIIKMRGKISDPKCLKCHSTGFGKPGGFVSEEATPNLEGKQCEVCHGPGSMHVGNPADQVIRAGMKNYVSENNVCIQCHQCMKTHKGNDF